MYLFSLLAICKRLCSGYTFKYEIREQNNYLASIDIINDLSKDVRLVLWEADGSVWTPRCHRAARNYTHLTTRCFNKAFAPGKKDFVQCIIYFVL